MKKELYLRCEILSYDDLFAISESIDVDNPLPVVYRDEFYNINDIHFTRNLDNRSDSRKSFVDIDTLVLSGRTEDNFYSKSIYIRKNSRLSVVIRKDFGVFNDSHQTALKKVSNISLKHHYLSSFLENFDFEYKDKKGSPATGLPKISDLKDDTEKGSPATGLPKISDLKDDTEKGSPVTGLPKISDLKDDTVFFPEADSNVTQKQNLSSKTLDSLELRPNSEIESDILDIAKRILTFKENDGSFESVEWARMKYDMRFLAEEINKEKLISIVKQDVKREIAEQKDMPVGLPQNSIDSQEVLKLRQEILDLKKENSDLKLKLSSKKRNTAKAGLVANENRVKEVKEKILTAVQLLNMTGDKITPKSVSEVSKVGVKTVRKYRDDFGY